MSILAENYNLGSTAPSLKFGFPKPVNIKPLVKEMKTFCKRFKYRSWTDHTYCSRDIIERFYYKSLSHRRALADFWVLLCFISVIYFIISAPTYHENCWALPPSFRCFVNSMIWMIAKTAGSPPFRTLVFRNRRALALSRTLVLLSFQRSQRNI